MSLEEENSLTGGIISYFLGKEAKAEGNRCFLLSWIASAAKAIRFAKKKKATQSELRKEEEKEKSQNHDRDLHLLHCIFLFNFFFNTMSS